MTYSVSKMKPLGKITLSVVGGRLLFALHSLEVGLLPHCGLLGHPARRKPKSGRVHSTVTMAPGAACQLWFH